MNGFKLSCTLSGHDQDVRDVKAVFNDLIISGSRDATVRIWKQYDQGNGWKQTTGSESVIAFNSPSGSFINAVAYVANEKEPLIAGAGKDCIIYLMDPAASDKKPGDDVGKYQLIGHQANICSLWTKDDTIISGSWDSTAKVWDVGTCNIKYDLKGHESSVWDAKILSEDTFLTCSADKTIRLWSGNHEVTRFVGHTDVIRKLLLLPGGKQFASCSNDCTVKIWDLETGSILQTLEGHESFVYDIGLLPNGDLVSSGEDRTVRVWRNGVVIQAITLPCISVWCVSVFPNGDFAVGGSDNTIRIFTRDVERVASPELLQEFKDLVQQSSIAEQSLDNLKKTDIPGYEALQKPGKQEGETIMVKHANGTIEAHQWSTNEWIKIGDVVGSAGNSGGKKEFDGQLWDYVFDVDIEDGAPPLKLPYNVNDNPYTAAQKFLADNELPSSYNDEVVRFIMKNTGGFQLDEQLGSTPTSAPNPYADSQQHQSTTEEKITHLSVIPEKNYINFKEFKTEQLVKGLTKINAEQKSKLSANDLDAIVTILKELTSKQALELINEYVPKIVNNWNEDSILIGYDLLRVGLIRINIVEMMRSTEVAVNILNTINTGLIAVNEERITLFMMILKVLNNLIGHPLFIQLYINPSDDGKYQFNEYFQELLDNLTRHLKKISTSTILQRSKFYSTTITTAATFVYNLSAYHIQTSLINSKKGSSKPVAEFIEKVGDILVQSNPEAAYRLMVAIGNYKYIHSSNKSPSWLDSAIDSYYESGEKRFIDLFSDLKKL